MYFLNIICSNFDLIAETHWIIYISKNLFPCAMGKKDTVGGSFGWLDRQVLYMSSSFWLLGIESHDFSQTEDKTTVYKAEQIHI